MVYEPKTLLGLISSLRLTVQTKGPAKGRTGARGSPSFMRADDRNLGYVLWGCRGCKGSFQATVTICDITSELGISRV